MLDTRYSWMWIRREKNDILGKSMIGSILEASIRGWVANDGLTTPEGKAVLLA